MIGNPSLLIKIFSYLPTRFIIWLLSTFQEAHAYNIMRNASEDDKLSPLELEGMFKEFQLREGQQRALILSGAT